MSPMTSSGLYGATDEFETITEVMEDAKTAQEELEVEYEAPRRKGGRPKGSKNKPKASTTSPINIDLSAEKLQDLIAQDIESERKWKEGIAKGYEEILRRDAQYNWSSGSTVFAVPVLNIYKVDPSVETPTYGTEGSACFDLRYNPVGKTSYTVYTRINGMSTRYFNDGKMVICAGETAMVPTGLIFDIAPGHCIKLYPRSGTSLKRKLTLANATGIVDSDYKEEVFLLVHNNSEIDAVLEAGERLAQGEVATAVRYNFNVLTSPPSKTTRDGGFGSTGVK